VLKAQGTDLAVSASYTENAYKWAQEVMSQAVHRCRPRTPFQETLLELAAARMCEHFHLPQDTRSLPSKGNVLQGRTSKRDHAVLVQTLGALKPSDAVRVWWFVEELRRARYRATLKLIYNAWQACQARHSRLLQLVSSQSNHRGSRVIMKRDALEPLSAALDSLPHVKASKMPPHVMSEARNLTVMHVPAYLSSAAVARLLSKSIMAAGLETFDALSCEEELDEDELQEGLVEALVDDEVLHALAEHADSLRELSFRLSSSVTSSSVNGILCATGTNLRSLSLSGIASVQSSNTNLAAADSGHHVPKPNLSGGELLLSQIPWQRLNALQILRLQQAPLTDQILININKALKSLDELDLSYCIRITDASMHHVMQKQEHLQVIVLNGCDNVADAALLALCARTWRMYNEKRDIHAVPLHFFDTFMSDTYKQSNAVVVQVHQQGANAALQSFSKAAGARKPPARAISLWQGVDPKGRNSVSFDDVKRVLKSFPPGFSEFLFHELQHSQKEEVKERADGGRTGGDEALLSFEMFLAHFWEILQPLDEHEEFIRGLSKMRQKLELETQPTAVKFLLQHSHASLVWLGCEASELHAALKTTEKETEHAYNLRILTMRNSAVDMLQAKAEMLGPLFQKLQRLHLLLSEVLGCAALEDNRGTPSDPRRAEAVSLLVPPALKAKIVHEGCWVAEKGNKGARSSLKASNGVSGEGGETRQAIASAVRRHMLSLKVQLRRYQSHVGSLLKLKDLQATTINGAFLKIEIKSAILSKDIVNPFADTAHADSDEDDDAQDGSSEALNVSDIRVCASVSMLCREPSQLPRQNTGTRDQTRTPQWNSVFFYDLCDATEVSSTSCDSSSLVHQCLVERICLTLLSPTSVRISLKLLTSTSSCPGRNYGGKG
jgi:hypothetical protein